MQTSRESPTALWYVYLCNLIDKWSDLKSAALPIVGDVFEDLPVSATPSRGSETIEAPRTTDISIAYKVLWIHAGKRATD
jgi:hypothetical protein